MKDKIITISFLIIIYLFSILGIIFKDNDISYTERRKLKQFPNLNFNNEYSNNLEKYLLDQYPYRDKFRNIKANFNYYILNKLENNDISLYKEGIFKSEYPTDYSSIDNYMDYILKLNTFFKNNNVYIMIVPDKNYYLNDKYFLNIDYNYIYKRINELSIKNIDIKNLLTIDDFYKTDTHWKQENLEKIVKTFINEVGINYNEIPYKKNIYNNFKGVYASLAGINIKDESIVYLENEYINKAKVKYLENSNLNKVYNESKLKSFDSYEVYLDGASAYIEINNEESLSNKELIIFRDSFGSSITPLFVPYYKKITLIDNRYISSKNFLELITLSNQDILFLNSTLLVNKSYTLKK